MNGEDRTTLAAEIAAEMEFALPRAAEGLAARLRQIKTLNADLARLGIVRRLANLASADDDTTIHDICGVAASASALPAFGGLLYGTAVHAHRLRLAQRNILDASEQVRVHMGDLDFYESGQRLLWKQTQHLFESVGELIEQPEPPRIILLDQPILMSRGQEGSRKQIEDIEEEWLGMVDTVNGFWKGQQPRIFPFAADGPIIASVGAQNALPLFLALNNNAETSADTIDTALPAYVRAGWTRLRQAGMTRMLDALLPPRSRTISYAFEDIHLDPRWQPTELHHSGVLGFFLRAGPQTPIWQVQIAGHRSHWTSERLDRLASDICQATIGTGAHAEPLPLWYARRLAAFPRNMLEVFRDLAREQVDGERG